MSPRRLADRRQRRRQRALFWGVVAAILVYVFFVGDYRPHHLVLLGLEERRTERRIDRLAAERDSLAAHRAALQRDTLLLEGLAREKGMIRPGDVVYRILPVAPGVREAAAESLTVRAARERAARVAESLAVARGEEPAR